jgi:uncharacterized protein (DUF4415 family)
MKMSEQSTSGNWIDPDDAPKLDQNWADSADAYKGGNLVRRGRPKLEQTKQHISIRLDPDVVAHFKAYGPRWQSLINDALRKAAHL